MRASILTALGGVVLAFFGVVRLGRAQGGRIGDDFLHLDWVAQRELPQWGAHMIGLGLLAVGAASVLWGTLGFLAAWRRSRDPDTSYK